MGVGDVKVLGQQRGDKAKWKPAATGAGAVRGGASEADAAVAGRWRKLAQGSRVWRTWFP